MYDIFNSEYKKDNQGLYTYPQFDYIKKKYISTVTEIEDYYHSRVYAVKSNNFIARLLNIALAPIEYSPVRYVEVVRDRLNTTVRELSITNESSYGKIHNGTFYGEGSLEIILSVDEWFDISEVSLNWRNVSPIKVLTDCKSDLSLLLPLGKKTSTGSGLTVISINIPMLLLQYRQFYLDQWHQFRTSQSLLGDSHFIHMYVLPNMLASQLDMNLFNRLMNLYYGRPMSSVSARHAITFSDYTSKVDEILLKVLDRISSNKYLIENIFMNIPSFYTKNMLTALVMPDMPTTRQVWWALLLSRIDVIKFALDICRDSGSIGMNRTFINDLKIELKRLDRENILKNILPVDMLFDYTELIKDIMGI